MPSERDDELLDIISDAIDESMDVDWTSRDGARHVLGALQIGGYLAEQRGYDRAIAEVVAWLGAYIAESHCTEGALHAGWIKDAIEAGEHKP